MRFYIVGDAAPSVVNRVLVSYINEREFHFWAEKGVEIFLDSGAFSVETRGVEVKLHDYINFVKEHEEDIEVYANLDVISCPKETLKNQLLMEKAGLNPLPCFHFGEDFSYLKYYCDNYEYIGLGGQAGKERKKDQQKMWLDRIFSLYPDKKFHGYGVGSIAFLERYPFYSADSTGPLMTAIYGGIYTKYGTIKISLDANSESNKMHYFLLKQEEKKVMKKMIKDNGYSLNDLATNTKSRARWNIEYIKREIPKIEKKKFQALPTLFSERFDEINVPDIDKEWRELRKKIVDKKGDR